MLPALICRTSLVNLVSDSKGASRSCHAFLGL